MGNLISLAAHKRILLAHKAFRLCRSYFPHDGLWRDTTSWMDLPDPIVLAFASEDHNAQAALYDVIMVCQECGRGDDFKAQKMDKLCHLLNGYFYLVDLARFEIMARLDWVERFAPLEKPLIDLASAPWSYEPEALLENPPLRPLHPGYAQGEQETTMDRTVTTRKAVPEALQRFRAKIQNFIQD